MRAHMRRKARYLATSSKRFMGTESWHSMDGAKNPPRGRGESPPRYKLGIGKGKGDFLDGRGPSLPHVRPADHDRLEMGVMSGAVFHGINTNFREGVGERCRRPGHIFLQNIVLPYNAILGWGQSLLLPRARTGQHNGPDGVRGGKDLQG